MLNISSPPITTSQPAVRIGGHHGYRLDGDQAQINAELTVLNADAVTTDWALQLWACDTPYSGGELHGIKVAEAPVTLSAEPQPLEVNTNAFPPAGPQAHTMVLVIVSGAQGCFDTIHDFVNYPAQQAFLQPRLQGPVSYRQAGEHLHVQVAAIDNPRSAENLSGTLSLELWALTEPYQGGAFSGVQLATTELGRLAGGAQWTDITVDITCNTTIVGRWQVTLMLREWTVNGYITRDFTSFEQPLVVEEQTTAQSEQVASLSLAQPEQPEQAAAQPEQAAAQPEQAAAQPEQAAAQPEQAAQPEPPVSAAQDDGRVSINSASRDALRAVKGLSQKVADAIIAGRPYSNLDALLKVKGIGIKLLEKVKESLKV